MKNFNEWYKDYFQNELNEEPIAGNVKKPYYVPPASGFGGIQRQAMGLWDRLSGKGDPDWVARDLANKQVVDKHQQNVTNQANADKPAVQAAKAANLNQLFVTALLKAAPGANPTTQAVLKQGAATLADQFTNNKPILHNSVGDMLNAVHQDMGIDDAVKKQYWTHHGPVMSQILQPAFQSNPQNWYDPNAGNDINKRYPPGSHMDPQAWEVAAKQFVQSRASANLPSNDVVDVHDILITLGGVQPGQLSWAELQQRVMMVVNNVQQQGGKPKVDWVKIGQLANTPPPGGMPNPNNP